MRSEVSRVAERALSVCDLDSTPTVAVAHVSIDVNGEQRVLDLCEAHVEQFRSVVAEFLPAAASAPAPTRGGRRGGARAAASGRTSGRARAGGRTGGRAAAGRRRRSGPDTAAVRAWAREQGITVSDRGRLSSDIVSRYEQAQSAGA